jgi:exodeoxyribonuclease VII small subunit
MEAKQSDPKQSDHFETSLTRLDEIVKQLESGAVGLDESVELFREGKGLAARCEGLLQTAEQTIAKLSEGDPTLV